MTRPGGLLRLTGIAVFSLALQGQGGPIAATAAETTPAEIAAAFCATRLVGDDEEVRALLTPSLLAAIGEAEDRNLAAMEAAPDEKPPFGDGIPYQSFPDLPDGCAAGAESPTGEAVRIAVDLSFRDAPTAGWRDTLLLVPADGVYRIDDIEFRGAPDGSDAPTLRQILREAFDN